MRRKKRRNPFVTLLLWIAAIVIAFGISQYLRTNVFEVIKVSGDSMYETMMDGDLVLVTKGDYREQAPMRGEIVAIRDDKGVILRRIIGLPGETIEVKDGETYINGERFLESYMFRTYENYEGRTVSPNRYYVMGDNRMSTYDSRDDSLGLIAAEDLVGKVRYVIWPFNHFTTF
ncbi:MAG: signal peptidase I [Clostridia bacterium]|nr:signal peptidase I [Clostridia bacterium]